MTTVATSSNSANAKTQKAAFWVCFVAGVVGGTIATIAIVFLIYHLIDIDFVRNASCGVKGTFHYCFFDEAWDSGEYLSAITTFYSTIVTILAAFLAMVATLAFLVVRTSAGHHAQEAMEDEVTKYFASNVAGAFIEEKLGALASDLVVRQTTDLQVQVETIRSVLEEDGYIIPGTLTK